MKWLFGPGLSLNFLSLTFQSPQHLENLQKLLILMKGPFKEAKVQCEFSRAVCSRHNPLKCALNDNEMGMRLKMNRLLTGIVVAV